MQEVEAICDRVIIIDKGKIALKQKLRFNCSRQRTSHSEFDFKVTEDQINAIPYLKSFIKTVIIYGN